MWNFCRLSPSGDTLQTPGPELISDSSHSQPLLSGLTPRCFPVFPDRTFSNPDWTPTHSVLQEIRDNDVPADSRLLIQDANLPAVMACHANEESPRTGGDSHAR